jgi:hypothetical protein
MRLCQKHRFNIVQKWQTNSYFRPNDSFSVLHKSFQGWRSSTMLSSDTAIANCTNLCYLHIQTRHTFASLFSNNFWFILTSQAIKRIKYVMIIQRFTQTLKNEIFFYFTSVRAFCVYTSECCAEKKNEMHWCILCIKLYIISDSDKNQEEDFWAFFVFSRSRLQVYFSLQRTIRRTTTSSQC